MSVLVTWPYWPLLATALAALVAAVVALAVRARRRALPPPAERPGLAPSPAEKALPPAGVAPALPAVELPTALREGLARTRGGFIARIAGLLAKKEIDAALLGELEEVLITADIGVKTSQRLFEAVR